MKRFKNKYLLQNRSKALKEALLDSWQIPELTKIQPKPKA